MLGGESVDAFQMLRQTLAARKGGRPLGPMWKHFTKLVKKNKSVFGRRVPHASKRVNWTEFIYVL